MSAGAKDFVDAGGSRGAGTREPAVHIEAGAGPPLTDPGNAERFAAQHHERVKYCFEWGAWTMYDGRRWARDRVGEVFRS